MTNPWFDAQKKFLENWSSAMQAPFSMSGTINGIPDGSAFWQNPWIYWQNVMQKSMTSVPSPWFMGEAWAETARSTAERMMTSQAQTMQLLQQVTDAWQMLAASAMNGGDWEEALASYTSGLRQQWKTTTEQMLALNASTGQLWTTYLHGLQSAGQPWLQAWSTTLTQWPAQMGAAVDSAGNGSFSGFPSTATLMAPYWDAMQQTLGESLHTPPLGLTREYAHLFNTAFDAWLENRRAEFEYQSLINEGWISTFEALMRRLVADAQAGDAVQTPRGMIDLWVEVGDDVFTDLFQSERYATAQAALVNSSMRLKLKQRELLERWLITNDMPTRTEVDEAHRVIHGLRKDIKTLRKQIAGAAQAAQEQESDAQFAASEALETLEQKLAAVEKRQTKVEKDVKKQASAAKPKRRTRKSTSTSSKGSADSSAKGSKTAAAEGDAIKAESNDGSTEAGES